jgi:hypothetical protein
MILELWFIKAIGFRDQDMVWDGPGQLVNHRCSRFTARWKLFDGSTVIDVRPSNDGQEHLLDYNTLCNCVIRRTNVKQFICTVDRGFDTKNVNHIRPMNLAHPPLKKKGMAPWRVRGNQQEKAYSRRQFVWSKIERLITEGASEAEAVAAVEREIGDASSIYTKVDKLRKAARVNE